MAYQFAHISFFSRKANSKGQSTSFIFSEARRDPEASTHVKDPKPPDVVYGLGIDELEALHDKQASEATSTNAKGQTRKIRQDQQTLACVVLSYPKDGKDYPEWEKKSLEWLQEKYGDNLKSVIRHTDESHPHLHAYLMSGDMKASIFNDGKQAKDAFMSSQAAQEMDKKAANKLGDKAYRQAMRDWQDSYFESVGVHCGLSRIGPGNRRLSRDEWHNEQKQAASLKRAISQKNNYVSKTKEQAKQEADQLIQEAKKQAAKILADADRKLQDIQKNISQEEEKLSTIKNSWFVKRLYENIRADRIKEGIKKSSSQISKLKKSINTLKKEKEIILKEKEFSDELRRKDMLISDKIGLENQILKDNVFSLQRENVNLEKEKEDYKERWSTLDNQLSIQSQKSNYKK